MLDAHRRMVATRTLAATLLMLAAVTACSDSDSDPNTPPPDTTVTIGPDGGMVQAAGGAASVDIPTGSLNTDTAIAVTEVPQAMLPTPPENTTLAGDAFAFTPHGTVFTAAVTLSLPYDPITSGALAVLRLDDENDTTWEMLTGGRFSNGTATIEVSRFSILAVSASTGTNNARLLTITGTATPDAAVVAAVGNQVFSATADASGRYSIDITGGGNDDLVSIRAVGSAARGEEKIELAGYLDTLGNLITQAGPDLILDDSDNRATRLSALTTARFVLINQLTSGGPADRDALATADRNINGSTNLFFVDLAAIIQQFVDDPSLIPASASTTLSFAADRDAAAAYAYANSANGANGFLDLSALRDRMLRRDDLFETMTSAPVVGPTFRQSFLSKNDIVPVRGGGSLEFLANGTGTEQPFKFDQLNSTNISFPFTWNTLPSGALNVTYGSSPEVSFLVLDEEAVVALINDPANEQAIRTGYQTLSQSVSQFQRELVRTEYDRIPGPIGAELMKTTNVYVYRFAQPFATVGVTVPDVEERLASGVTTLQTVADVAFTPFTDQQLRNQTWAMRIVGPSRYQSIFGDYNVNADIVGHTLITFNDDQSATVLAEGNFTVPFALTWALSADGVLTLTYANGNTQSFRIIASSSGAFGLLSSYDAFGATYTEYASAVQVDGALTIAADDLVVPADRYWTNTINAASQTRLDVNFPSRWERFGFQFFADGRSTRLSTYNGQSFDFVEDFWRFEIDGRLIQINAYADEFGINSLRCPGDISCTIWRQRQWIPLLQQGPLLHVLEWDKRWPTVGEASWDATTQTWRQLDGSPIDDSIFSWIIAGRINAYYVIDIAEP